MLFIQGDNNFALADPATLGQTLAGKLSIPVVTEHYCKALYKFHGNSDSTTSNNLEDKSYIMKKESNYFAFVVIVVKYRSVGKGKCKCTAPK